MTLSINKTLQVLKVPSLAECDSSAASFEIKFGPIRTLDQRPATNESLANFASVSPPKNSCRSAHPVKQSW